MIKTDTANIQHEIDQARNWCNITTNNSKGFTGYCYAGWSDAFQANRWNGLYSLAYFGWIDRNADDFQDEWKTFISPGGDNGEPVLLMLRTVGMFLLVTGHEV